MIFVIFFLFLGYIWDFENLKKSSKFRKICRKSSFGVSINLNHLVSETTSLSGHFGVFTTHITNFSLSLDLMKKLTISLKYGENRSRNSLKVHDGK